MKKFLKLTLLSLCMLSLVGCTKSYGQKIPIEDAPKLEAMNVLVKDGIEHYFDIAIPQDLIFEYEAFESHLPSSEDSETLMHFNDIFQAMLKDKPIPGKISGYGGVLSPEDQELVGLIVNIHDEDTKPQAFSEDQLKEIAINFLKSKELIGADESLTFTNVNKDASSKIVQILNFETATTRYAVGINMQFGKVVYFEHVPLNILQ